MKIKDIAVVALFVAILAVFSQIIIPVFAIPMSLSLLAVYLASFYLGTKRAVVVVLAYILLGIIGVPVFAGFKGGFSVIASLTGGYIVGYVIIAIISGLTAKKNYYVQFAFALISLLICYAFGTIWFSVLSGEHNFWSALAICVLPYIVPDIVKIVTAIFLANTMKKSRSENITPTEK